MFLPALALAPDDLDPATRVCPLCRRDATALFHRVGEFGYRRCPRCTLVFLDPRPRAEVLLERYRAIPLEPAEANRAHMRPIYGRALAALERTARRGAGEGRLQPPATPTWRRLLDVGCGWGHFVAMAREQGWAAEGYDVSEPSAAYALTRYGLAIHRAPPPGPFDAVTLFFVLEHVADPVGFLTALRARLAPSEARRESGRVEGLAPGGLLACVTPWTSPLVKAARLAAPRANLYETPWHLADFSPAALRATFRRAGFEILSIGPAGVPGHVRGMTRASLALLDAAGRALSRASGGRAHVPGLSLLTLARPASGMP